jgi:hypothetical protein
MAAAALALSCAGGPMVPYRNDLAIKKSAYGSPSDCALVYGSAAQIKFLLAPGPLNNLEMIQLNPEQQPMIITPARSGYTFFTEPLAVGSSIRIFYFSITQGRVTTFYHRGIQGSGPTDVKLAKPGLLYLGSLVYCDKKYLEDKKFSFRVWDGGTTDLYPAGEESETSALKALLPKFRGTDWEPLINARIEELKK